MLGDSSLVWTDGTPTDFALWREEGRLDWRSAGLDNCLAVFSDRVFQHTRLHFEILRKSESIGV